MWVLLFFVTTIINLMLWKTIQVFVEIIFIFFFFLLSPLLKIFIIRRSSIDEITLPFEFFYFLAFYFLFFSFLLLFFWFGKILRYTMNWVSNGWWFLFKVFLKEFDFRLKEGSMENLLIFRYKETWPNIILNLWLLDFQRD